MSRPAAGEISSVQEAIDLAVAYSSEGCWWRGVPDSRFGLVPSAFREGWARFQEEQRFIHFRREARTRHPNCPRDHEDSAWLFLAQHFGLPTRLLDWSRSVLIALFFAVEVDLGPADPGLWVLRPGRLNGHFVGRATIFSPRSTVQANDQMAKSVHNVADGFSMRHMIAESANAELRATEAALALFPDEIDLRMQLQQSTFTVHGTAEPLEDMVEDDIVRMIRIPKENREAIRATLGALGIRRSTLFPDLDNLARDISDRYFEPF